MAGKCGIARCHTCDVEEAAKLTNPSSVKCGNEHHPAGAWHDATPLPMATIFGRSRAERRYRDNIRRWGCGCDA